MAPALDGGVGKAHVGCAFETLSQSRVFEGALVSAPVDAIGKVIISYLLLDILDICGARRARKFRKGIGASRATITTGGRGSAKREQGIWTFWVRQFAGAVNPFHGLSVLFYCLGRNFLRGGPRRD